MSMLTVHALHDARDRIHVLKQILSEALVTELSDYRKLLDEQIQRLDEALNDAKIPESYRVAVVGRFKVGKSSFVNNLSGERLAGVRTTPETAAISVFRYGETASAEVQFVDAQNWKLLADEYQADHTNPVVKRYKKFITFNERSSKKDADGNEAEREVFDLESMVKNWITPVGLSHKISSKDWGSRDGKSQFLKDIRKFTSSREPLHYLVDRLTIYAPIPILRDSIELIDTPGLDDTERFRVALTEELVKDVDAILFLTISGASYSASDKEFLIRQLRQKQIKHLQIIVTKCDETYENACRDAEEEGDDQPTFSEFKANEVSRVRSEINQTLEELLSANQLDETAGYYFIDQLDKVPIHLISANYHKDGRIEDGGIEQVKSGLYQMLSTSHRFERSIKILKDTLEQVLSSLRRSFSERLNSLETEFNPEKVEMEISRVRELLSTRLKEFESKMGECLGRLVTEQEALFEMLPLRLDNIQLLAKEVLGDIEKTDLAKHWKRLRYRGWGDLSDLQSKIADRVFPQVEVILNSLQSHLDGFMNSATEQLGSLQDELIGIEKKHDLSGLEAIGLSDLYAPKLEQTRSEYVALAQSHHDTIVCKLDEFISEEVESRLDDAKDSVEDIQGTGTARKQSTEVRQFYGTVRTLLTEALRSHLDQRVREYASSIQKSAGTVAPQIRASSDNAFKKRIDAIHSSLAVAASGRKDAVAAYLNRMLSQMNSFSGGHQPIRMSNIDIKREVIGNDEPKESAPPRKQHFEITEGETGWTYEKIFCPFIESATSIVIEDPYINLSYQIDNLTRFCALAVRLGVAEKIELITKDWIGEANDLADGRLETLRRDLKSRGIEFNWRRDENIHDREIRLNNSWAIKIGRGLDIYQRPESWTSVSASDFSLRPCKQTKIDVFRSDQ